MFLYRYDGSKEIQLKVIPKTKRQAHIIRKSFMSINDAYCSVFMCFTACVLFICTGSAIASNFIFASLSEDEIRSVVRLLLICVG